jgi:hypothetical protein
MAVATTNKRRRIGTRIKARVKKVFFTLPEFMNISLESEVNEIVKA